MFSRRRNHQAAERARERRDLEDSAARLRDEVPELVSLRLEVSEFEGDRQIPEASHIRRIVVEHAPALFLLGCTDQRCVDGGHDLTRDMMRALRSHQSRFDGEHVCPGRTGSADCSRRLHYVAIASYSDDPS